MQFYIADSFQKSLARLPAAELKEAKVAALDLQLDPAHPSLKFHKLDRAVDKNFWSVRANRDVRLIVHRADGALSLLYVGRHDDAYRWAERRRYEVHPATGAAQIVEVQEVAAGPTHAATIGAVDEGGPGLLDAYTDAELLAAGVPTSWVSAVRSIVDDDGAIEVAERLPAEAAEAVLRVAAGGTLPGVEPRVEEVAPMEHPDAQRRFRLVTDDADLRHALDYPWDLWTVFLHPGQRSLVVQDFSGPARVAGSAGTGKTVVAIHRAAHLARNSTSGRVLLTTFNAKLASALRDNLAHLVGADSELFARIEVESLNDVALRLHRELIGEIKLADLERMNEAVESAVKLENDYQFPSRFIMEEWTSVVDAWQIESWDEYKSVQRLGRRTSLSEPRRELAWKLISLAREELANEGFSTIAAVHGALAGVFAAGAIRPYSHLVVDEAQDVSVSQLRLLAALAGDSPNGLFFAGDLGQRIFRTPFSWLSTGVDIRGRSRILRVNYRTSHEIRSTADQLLPTSIADVDGTNESRDGTVSVFRGPSPAIELLATIEEEAAAVGGWLRACVADGLNHDEIAVFVRSSELLPRAKQAVESAAVGAVIQTMSDAKGLEFRAVVAMACDEDVLPLQNRIESIGDQADLDDVLETERYLLYVACTRARDRLLVSGVTPGSEFLEDLAAK